MKTTRLLFTTLILSAIVCFTGPAPCHAQTTQTLLFQTEPANPPPVASVETATNASGGTNTTVNKQTLGDDFKQLGSDAWNSLKGLDFAPGITVEPFGIYHSGDFGGGIAVSTANTNSIINFGFAIAVISDKKNKRTDFYDTSFSVELGKTVTVPIIKLPAYLYVETGPAFNLAHPTTVLEQSIAGAKLTQDLGKGWRLSEGLGVGHNSEWANSPLYILHIGLTKFFK